MRTHVFSAVTVPPQLRRPLEATPSLSPRAAPSGTGCPRRAGPGHGTPSLNPRAAPSGTGCPRCVAPGGQSASLHAIPSPSVQDPSQAAGKTPCDLVRHPLVVHPGEPLAVVALSSRRVHPTAPRHPSRCGSTYLPEQSKFRFSRDDSVRVSLSNKEMSWCLNLKLHGRWIKICWTLACFSTSFRVYLYVHLATSYLNFYASFSDRTS